MPRLCAFIVVLVICQLSHMNAHAQSDSSSLQPLLTAKGLQGVPTFTESDLKSRVYELPNSIVSPQFNAVVKGYIHKYVMRSRSHTEDMLGRASLYFPVIEKHLIEEGLPIELRCLPIVESALNPNAISPAHAVGLWQFMPETAREQGLRIDRYVDERRDPYRSTQGALTYLRKLHERFDDWALALAAYNAGAGRVNRAIRKAQSTDFWKVREYLPRETSNYVPAFIAALYVWNYAHLHNLKPRLPERDLRHTCRILIYHRLSFSEIERLTGVSAETIAFLNPSYRKHVIPASTDGQYIVLPALATGPFIHHLHQIDTSKTFLVSTTLPEDQTILPEWHDAQPDGIKTFWHQVERGETLSSISCLYRCASEDLIRWNQLGNSTIKTGEHLIIHTPLPLPVLFSPFSKLTTQPIEPIPEPKRLIALPEFRVQDPTSSMHIKHYLQRGESLLDLVQQYPHTNLEEIIQMNDFRDTRFPKPGDLILLPISP